LIILFIIQLILRIFNLKDYLTNLINFNYLILKTLKILT